MRWFNKEKENPYEGVRRVRTVFLWFPTIIDNEWRWLEEATFEERYMDSVLAYDAYVPGHWEKIRWINIEEEK